MKVTVLICTRNRSDIIESCISSILNNTYKDFEFLIVDQSTDKKTEEIVKKHILVDKRIRYIHMNATGKTKALNFGIRNSSGDIIAMTDDDCVISKDWLEKIVEAFQKNPDVAIVFGSVVDNRSLGRSLIKDGGFAGRLSKLLFTGDGANSSIKRIVWKKINGFDEFLGPGAPLLGDEDQDFVYRALRAGFRVLCVRKIIVTHYQYRIRNLNNYISVIREFHIGTSAYCFKHIRCGDYAAIIILLGRLVRRIYLMTQLILKTKKLPTETPRIFLLLRIWFLYVYWTLLGIIKSLKYPVDKTHCLFMST